MAIGINKVILLGRLGKDPEIKQTVNGNSIANITLATSESWKNQSGEQQEHTEWHRIVIFGKLAEIAFKYLKKGDQVYFEGKIQTRKWTDGSGQDRYSTEITIPQIGGVMQMLNTKNNNEKFDDSKQNEYLKKSEPVFQSKIEEDDIPF